MRDDVRIDETCIICGDHVGGGFDHAECSKVKKEMYGDRHKSTSKKKLSKQDCDYLGRSLSPY